MPRKKRTPEEIIHNLREAEVLLSQGQKVQQVASLTRVFEGRNEVATISILNEGIKQI